jgi:hypothetical protein
MYVSSKNPSMAFAKHLEIGMQNSPPHSLYGFEQSVGDHCLFTYSLTHYFIVVLIYVDDLIIARNDITTLTNSNLEFVFFG